MKDCTSLPPHTSLMRAAISRAVPACRGPRARRLCATVLALLSPCLLAPLPCQAVVVGGRITDAASGAPLLAAVFAGDAAFDLSTATDSDGRYRFDLPTDDPWNDHVYFRAQASGYVVANGQLPQDSTTLDFALQRGGTISGSVFVAGTPTKQPMVDTFVQVFDASTLHYVTTTFTDAKGHFETDTIAPGQYAVCDMDFFDHYRNVCYGGEPLPVTGTISEFAPVTVAAGHVTDGIGFLVQPGAKITAILHDAYLGGLVAGAEAQVRIYSDAGALVGDMGGFTSSDGALVLDGLPGGDYYLSTGAFPDPYATNTYYPETLYQGGECTPVCPFGGSTRVHLPDQGTLQLDFDLFPGRVVRGRVTDAASGAGVPGITVQAGEFCYPNVHCISATATTDADGNYVLAHIVGDNGVYVATHQNPGWHDEVWPHIPCGTAADCLFGGSGGLIPFGAPHQVVGGIDFALEQFMDGIFRANFE